jgi:hypothetical protein
VGVKIDEDNLKILDDLPSSAVEMQVKSKVSMRVRFYSAFYTLADIDTIQKFNCEK